MSARARAQTPPEPDAPDDVEEPQPPAAPPASPAAVPVRAQEQTHPQEERTAHNALFFELLGNGLVYSINYERLFGSSEIGLRAGLSVFATEGDRTSHLDVTTVPVLVNYYGLGGTHHKLQLGAGVTFVSASDFSKKFGLVGGLTPEPTLAIGYRYLPNDGGFCFFLGFTPLLTAYPDRPFLPLFGMSFGGIF